MLRKIRVGLAVLFWLGITMLLLDVSGTFHTYLSWMAKLQFLPAVLALNFAVVIAFVLVTLVLGRAYCSIVCPLGVFQDIIAHIRVRRDKRNKKNKPYNYSEELKWLRYTVWALFIIALVAGFQVFVALLAPYSSYGRIVQNLFQPLALWCNNLFAALSAHAGSYAAYSHEVWLRSIPTFIIATITIIAIVIFAWRGGRTYCNTICPVGTTLSFFSRFSLFRPVIDADKCRNCRICEHNCKASCINITDHSIDYSRCVDCFNCIDNCKFGSMNYKLAWRKHSTQAKSGQSSEVSAPETKTAGNEPDASRRAFLTASALALGTIAIKAQDKKLDGGFADVLPKKAPQRSVSITPPGSKSVKDFYAHCTGCQLCVAECPNNVLRPSASINRLMQPEMSFEKGFCRPECTRCSEVCPTGAILKIDTAQKTAYHVGIASVIPDLCLAANGTSSCGNCAQKCPTGAISMVRASGSRNRTPVIAEEICIGCGACEFLCPVRPVSAITVNGRHDHLINAADRQQAMM